MLLDLKNISMDFQSSTWGFGSRVKRAVEDVSLSIQKNETIGLVGESGSGKSTLGKIAIGLLKPTAGSVIYNSMNIWDDKEARKHLRKETRMVFQNLDATFNPHMKVRESVDEPLRLYTTLSKDERQKRIEDLFQQVNLPLHLANEYPHTLSGGQKRRVSLARAVAVVPQFIIADEPVSALDVSVKAQIIEMMLELKRAYSISMLFISHDIEVLASICDTIAVMKDGRIVEKLTMQDFSDSKYKHPYTKLLTSSVLKV